MQKLPKIYSKDLVEILFMHPYTKIEFIMNDLGIKRLTAAKYLDMLVDLELLKKIKVGRENYYLNTKLIDLFMNFSVEVQDNELNRIITTHE